MAHDEEQEIDAVLERLRQRFSGIEPDAIESTLRAVHQRFEGNPIRDYVPLLVERAATSELNRSAAG
ncbi:three-helix bundle dimerization domain-containing protein [Microlunatus sp. GCM10028923]|uniref:three-helix bundle dimerization domain-containing protein n=1 Tax=Microlunatus sp. GCM10028923 TaxID=3273400 RepID=UPI00361EAE35